MDEIIRMKSGRYLHRQLNMIEEDLRVGGSILDKVDLRVKFFFFFF